MMAEAFAYHHGDLGTKWGVYGKFTRMTLGRGGALSRRRLRAGTTLSLLLPETVARRHGRCRCADHADQTWCRLRKWPRWICRSAWPAPATPAFGTSPAVPALSLPCGFSSRTLPLSLQIIARPFDEATTLKVGGAYQRLTDWHLQVPPIAVAVPA